MSRADIRVLEDPAAEVAEMLREAARAGGHIVLTGGSSPKARVRARGRRGRRLERRDGLGRRRALRGGPTTSARTSRWCSPRCCRDSTRRRPSIAWRASAGRRRAAEAYGKRSCAASYLTRYISRS